MVEDLPFEGVKLCGEKTDASFHSLKDSRASLGSLGIYTPGQRRQVSPRYQHRPYSAEFLAQQLYQPQRKKGRFSKQKPSGSEASTQLPAPKPRF